MEMRRSKSSSRNKSSSTSSSSNSEDEEAIRQKFNCSRRKMGRWWCWLVVLYGNHEI